MGLKFRISQSQLHGFWKYNTKLLDYPFNYGTYSVTAVNHIHFCLFCWFPKFILAGTGSFKFAAGGSKRSIKNLWPLSHMFVATVSAILVGKRNVWSSPLSWDHCCWLPTWTTLPIRPLGLIKYRSFLFEKWLAVSFCTNQNLIISPSDI